MHWQSKPLSTDHGRTAQHVVRKVIPRHRPSDACLRGALPALAVACSGVGLGARRLGQQLASEAPLPIAEASALRHAANGLVPLRRER